MTDDKIPGVRIVSTPPRRAMAAIHRRYGLWIFAFGRGKQSCTPAMDSASEPVEPRQFEFYGLSHLIQGEGVYWTSGGRVVRLTPGDAVLTTPGFVHAYGAARREYVEDSISFCGPVADHLAQCGILYNGIVRIGRARRLLAVLELAVDPSPDSQINANMALQQLLVELYHVKRTSALSERPDGIDAVLGQIQARPERWWTVSEMAELSGFSENQFRRNFQAKVGMRPKTYVDQMKVRLAGERLVGSDVSIQEVARAFGYQDPYHFSRRFKEITGMSPTAYRRSTV